MPEQELGPAAEGDTHDDEANVAAMLDPNATPTKRVQWIPHRREFVAGRNRYRADTFECPENLIPALEKQGKIKVLG